MGDMVDYRYGRDGGLQIWERWWITDMGEMVDYRYGRDGGLQIWEIWWITDMGKMVDYRYGRDGDCHYANIVTTHTPCYKHSK